MSTGTKCVALTGFFLLFLSAFFSAYAHAADDSTSADIVTAILNTLMSESADKSIVDQVHRDDDFARDFVGFLNRDFRTNAFDRPSKITCADVQYAIDGGKNHFGFAVIAFSSPEDLNRAFKAALSVGRYNFKIKVLTVFRLFRVGRNFIILYSESPRSPQTIRLFNSLALTFAANDGQ